MAGSTTERGYGAPHQTKRREWKPRVDAGLVDCHAVHCLEESDGHGRLIEPGTPWDLGHTPDRSRWTGPEHARCNRHESAVRTARARGWRGGTCPGCDLDEDAYLEPAEPAEALAFFE